MRKRFIIGNWKMNKNSSETQEFLSEFLSLPYKNHHTDIAFCVPFTSLYAAQKALRGSGILAGVQNMHYETSGAFTGEISAEMAVAEGARCVLIGHSERREYFNETDTAVNKKTQKALKIGLLPIVCVGETLAEKEENTTKKRVKSQVLAALEGIDADEISKIVLAYEPIWAIGTGKTATAEDANEVIRFIRSVVADHFGSPVAERIRILYGGSMNGKNAAELLATSDIDGGLIGGASLVPNAFFDIIKCV